VAPQWLAYAMGCCNQSIEVAMEEAGNRQAGLDFEGQKPTDLVAERLGSSRLGFGLVGAGSDAVSLVLKAHLQAARTMTE
jgi:hypothetical protein